MSLATTIAAYTRKICTTLGLTAFVAAPRDTHLLVAQRFVRFMAYAATTIVFALYLSALGFEDAAIGLFMTLTLVGDVTISFVLTAAGDGLGRRNVLMAGALGMVLSGVVFALSSNYWIMLLGAVVGVVSPSGNEVGPFRAIEESTLAHLTPLEVRGDIFAWYSLISNIGIAVGMLIAGAFVEHLQTGLGWTDIASYRTTFWAYAALGAVKFVLSWMLSEACESKPAAHVPVPQDEHSAEEAGLLSDTSDEEESEETERELAERSPTVASSTSKPNGTPLDSATKSPLETNQPRSRLRGLLPQISAESRKVVVKISILFAFDSFASGLVSMAWISYFFAQKFGVDESTLGKLFAVTNTVAAISVLFSVPLTKRIGPVKAMAFTHLPSSIFLSLIGVFPNELLSMSFLVLRYSTAQMDVAPRQAFLAAVVLPTERTAIMGTVNVIKTAASSAAPTVTGVLAGINMFWLVFVIGGGLKASYDLALLYMFAGFKPREEEVQPPPRPDSPIHMELSPQTSRSEEQNLPR